jgi:hypothetical protein
MQSEANADSLMTVLCVYLAVVGSHIDFQVASLLPLSFEHFDSGYFLPEDGLCNDIPEQPFANWPVAFESVHDISQIDWEARDEEEESAKSQEEDSSLRLVLSQKISFRVPFQQLLRIYGEIPLSLQIIQPFLDHPETVS